MREIIVLVVTVLLLFCGCVQEEKSMTTTTMIAATTSPQTTSSTTTTTITRTTEAQTTTSTTTAICSTTTTTMPWDEDCIGYCIGEGYLSGSCQVNLQECQRRLMDAPKYKGTLCSDLRFDYCCCKTNASIDRDTCFAFDALSNKNL